jgi:hypothetical protein
MYRTTGIGTSIVVIAAGAILYWAVDKQVSGIDLDAVGVILMIAGAVGLLLSLILGTRPERERTVVADRGAVGDPGAPYVASERAAVTPDRERVIERERY